MTSITPFLWFANNVQEAVAFYKAVFPNAKVETVSDSMAPRVTSNSSGCGQSNSSTREAGQGTVSLSLFPGQELQRLL
ncbi:putative 3-demethylubiquinone-9 3-methyltransferase (glyoxalase superfamily) [Bradyrhizobium japonicum]